MNKSGTTVLRYYIDDSHVWGVDRLSVAGGCGHMCVCACECASVRVLGVLPFFMVSKSVYQRLSDTSVRVC